MSLSNKYLVSCIFVIIVIWISISGSSAVVQVKNVTAIDGGMVLLNCTLPNHHGPVMWLQPKDSAPVSRNYDVISAAKIKFVRIIGDPTKGEYHLLLRYARHPVDVGTWTCASDDMSIKVNLMLLVPPATKMASVTPKEIKDVGDAGEKSIYTITCTAHYAFPPVQLSWIKEIGPDAVYDVTPPSVVMSRSQTMSLGIKLILTASNAGSQFACIASHPTFMGQSYSTLFNFVLPEDGIVQAQAQVFVNRPTVQNSKQKEMIFASLDANDRALILLFVVFSSLCFLVFMILSKFRSRWDWNVPVNKVDRNLNTKPLCDTFEESEPKYQLHVKRRKFVYRTVVTVVVLLLLLITILFSFPVYFKSLTIPVVPNADELASVFAGSALWLDCRQLVEPTTSLVQVTWYQNEDRFYHQYYLNGQNIGYPHNSTKGFMLGIRVSSTSVGQITIWPVAPGEEGLYSCQVIISTEDGVTVRRHKTSAVFVLMGPITNWALIILLTASLLFALVIFILFVYNSMRCHPSREIEEKNIEEA